ncbi:SMC-Scp complex subunit ScpB [Candidatus Woesearchaeota archaeon]|nr:SMC-Scp complex subunit ScpB [Candidatus Woesearchaeota archaeon]
MSQLKYRIEALLFSSARRMPLEELEKLTKASAEDIRESIEALKNDYLQRNSSIHIIDEGNAWKLTVKDEHIDAISQIVTKSELPKTLMETLAVIAFKYPMKQSDLIRIRTNKAYDHLLELERLGYIARQKFSRTKLIRLTPKFFEYFDLPPEKLKEKFKDFEGIAQAITEKDQETKKVAAKQSGQGKSPEIDVLDKQGKPVALEVYEETSQEKELQEAKGIITLKEDLGGLEVVDVEEREEPQQAEAQEEGITLTEEMGQDVVDEVRGLVEGSKGSKGPSQDEKTSAEVDSEIDRRVEELLTPKVGKSPEEPTQDNSEEPSQNEEEGQEEIENKFDEKENDERMHQPDGSESPEDKAYPQKQAKIEDIEDFDEAEIKHDQPRKGQKGLLE